MGRVRKGKYRHYKGKMYRVIGVARSSENPKEEMVVYMALYSSKKFGKNQLWARPREMFAQKVNVDGKMVPRFRYVGTKDKN
ncbi:MAG: DUF1653 domain-containing protein [Candidatus Micrarchaeota archaeon]|nr:DUF1653 domain-containing protein [Candidatus Micrarchaeota archaeon]MDE1848241.1 DUF1653 domain-containing protein [Candidatus Micrarchaeota archaeon]MDE1864905.1 DUF1653 domain-containing protein [Candidatus Micrarchaeota archaeon]